MNVYIFKFRTGAVFSVPATSKLAATQIIASSYHALYESIPFECFAVTTQLDEHGHIVEEV